MMRFYDAEEDTELELSNVEVDALVPESRGFRRLPFDLTLDSGASASVMDGSLVPEYPLESSKGSERGQKYVGAGGEKILNRGQNELSLCFKMGSWAKAFCKMPQFASRSWLCLTLARRVTSFCSVIKDP